MKKSIIKKLTYLTISAVVIFLLARASVKADDEEEYASQNQNVSQTIAASTDTKTVTTTKVETLKDSDGDGLLDKDDPHPNIAEIYIVEDKNANGIVDKFEKKSK
jgi:hypothetical protein